MIFPCIHHTLSVFADEVDLEQLRPVLRAPLIRGFALENSMEILPSKSLFSHVALRLLLRVIERLLLGQGEPFDRFESLFEVLDELLLGAEEKSSLGVVLKEGAGVGVDSGLQFSDLLDLFVLNSFDDSSDFLVRFLQSVASQDFFEVLRVGSWGELRVMRADFEVTGSDGLPQRWARVALIEALLALGWLRARRKLLKIFFHQIDLMDFHFVSLELHRDVIVVGPVKLLVLVHMSE